MYPLKPYESKTWLVHQFRSMIEKLGDSKLQADLMEMTSKLEQKGLYGVTENINGEERYLTEDEAHVRQSFQSEELENNDQDEIMLLQKNLEAENSSCSQDEKMKLNQLMKKNFRLPLLRRKQNKNLLEITDKTKLKHISNYEVLKRIQIVKKITSHRSSVYCIKFSLDQSLVITGSDDYLIKSYDRQTMQLQKHFRGHKNCIVDLLTKKVDNVEYLVSSSVDTQVRIWDLKTAECKVVLSWHSAACGPLSFASSNLVTTSDDGMCCLWDFEALVINSSKLRNATSTQSDSTTQQHAQDELSGSGTDDLELFDLDLLEDSVVGEKLLMRYRKRGHHVPIVLPHLQNKVKTNVNTVSTHISGYFISTGGDDGVARIWSVSEAEHKKCRTTPSAETIPEQGLSSKPYIDGSTRLCYSEHAHTSSITQVLWSHKGDRLLTSSIKAGTVNLWSWKSPKSSAEISTTQTSMEVLSVLFTKPRIMPLSSISSSSNRVSSMLVNEKEVNKLIKRLLENVDSSPDLDVEDFLEKETELSEQEKEKVRYLLYGEHKEKDKLATLDASIWSLDDKKVVTAHSTPTKANETIHCLDTSSFSEQIIKVWCSKTGTLLWQKRKHRRPCYTLITLPNQPSLIVSIGHDSQIIFWNIDTKQVLKQIMVPAMFGPSSLLDAVVNQMNSSEFYITDSYGRVIILSPYYESEVRDILGVKKERIYYTTFKNTFSELFFENDYKDLVYDSQGFCKDALMNLPPHQCPMYLCNTSFDRYRYQPNRSLQASNLSMVGREKNIRMLVSYLDETISQREENAMTEISHILELMDTLINLSTKCDMMRKLRLLNYSTIMKNVIKCNARFGRNSSLEPLSLPNSPDQQIFLTSATQETETDNIDRRRLRFSRISAPRRSERQRDRATNGLVQSFREATGTEQVERAREDIRHNAETYGRVAPRRRAARRAGERIRFYRNLVSQQALSSVMSPMLRAIEEDSEFSESDSDSVEVFDDPEEIIRQNRRRQREQIMTRTRTNTRRSTRLLESNSIDQEDSTVSEQQPHQTEQHNEEVNQIRSQAQVPLAHLANLDRSWLQLESLNHTFYDYVPQIGDEVVFCVQGFKEYLEVYFPGQVLAHLGKATESNYVLCRVTSLRYEFPQGHLPSVVAVTHLELLATPLQNTSSSRFWNPVDTREGFEISCVNHDCPDFLILKENFKESIKVSWERRNPLNCYYLAEDSSSSSVKELSFSTGSVLKVEPYDSAFPDSLWKSILIRWDEDSTEFRVSPWEIERQNENREDTIRSEVCLAQETIENLKKVLEEVKQEEYSQCFLERVDNELYPNYMLTVPVPLELNLISKRLENNYYRSLESIKFDVEQIYLNCINFNLPESEISRQACQLRNSLLKKIKLATRIDVHKQHSRSAQRSRIRVSRSLSQLGSNSSPQSQTRSTRRKRSSYQDELEDARAVVSTRPSRRVRQRISYAVPDSDDELIQEDQEAQAQEQNVAQTEDQVAERERRRMRRSGRHFPQIEEEEEQNTFETVRRSSRLNRTLET